MIDGVGISIYDMPPIINDFSDILHFHVESYMMLNLPITVHRRRLRLCPEIREPIFNIPYIFCVRFRSLDQNLQNSEVYKTASKFTGVNFSGHGKRWSVSISDGARCRSVGSFDVEEEAARAYDKALAALLLKNPER